MSFNAFLRFEQEFRGVLHFEHEFSEFLYLERAATYSRVPAGYFGPCEHMKSQSPECPELDTTLPRMPRLFLRYVRYF